MQVSNQCAYVLSFVYILHNSFVLKIVWNFWTEIVIVIFAIKPVLDIFKIQGISVIVFLSKTDLDS